MNINFGLKLWSTNKSLIEDAKKLIMEDTFQYIELTPIPNTSLDYFKNMSIPYVIHITTENHGLNIADPEIKDYNLELIHECILWADELKAKCLVLHPGYGSIENALDFLDNIKDNRIHIENMPKVGINNEKMIGYNPEQIKVLMGNKFSFCLDLNHAIKAASSLNIDYKDSIENFLKLKPKLFHIADGRTNYEKDEHLNFGEGNYNLNYMMEVVKNHSKENTTYITLETPRKSLNDDLKNVEIIRKILY